MAAKLQEGLASSPRILPGLRDMDPRTGI
ncbi:hypothetical protein ANOM_011850 [Aspergillus nomiae NRRL 13137]|uniref:Uncharacterized protein n=1 Tax=Aspergillus nomiae NRRL (strain ATCC 15546 / NRRL 13137 / CBS 260.88 / M93) TaxID=1509407 RepID=A0A0L1IKR6_ASPN3|nr:hypothetical protein ANOM_011850 [Aspergillus nomiae NRRL 13137]